MRALKFARGSPQALPFNRPLPILSSLTRHEATELLTALGQRSAEERIAHLLLHMMPRIAAVNVIREQRYPFPLRQQHIADAVGLTPVHVSRVLSLFRDRRLVALSKGVLTVFNLPELERIGSLK